MLLGIVSSEEDRQGAWQGRRVVVVAETFHRVTANSRDSKQETGLFLTSVYGIVSVFLYTSTFLLLPQCRDCLEFTKELIAAVSADLV